MPKLKIAAILIVLLFFFSCTKKNKLIQDDINISVTLVPYADFVKQITGNRAKVKTLIPPGANAHFLELSPKSVQEITESDIYFSVGELFRIEKEIQSKVKVENIVDCSKGIEVIDKNSHYWLSVANVKIITQNMLDELIKKYPQHKNYFINNRTKFINKLDSINSKIKEKLISKKNRNLFVYHPAWTYLANDYGLNEISIERDGKSPKAQELKNFIKFAKEQNASCIFFDPNFDESSVKTIANSLNINIDSLNPLPENFLENLEEIGNKLEKHLR
ncbi:MAG: hypothetical protein CR986_07050 [Ignavibacteriae bacterium]|nr:MAG: hypothetical protein CR986_07050 [Ignavibacteriota bacterium]